MDQFSNKPLLVFYSHDLVFELINTRFWQKLEFGHHTLIKGFQINWSKIVMTNLIKTTGKKVMKDNTMRLSKMAASNIRYTLFPTKRAVINLFC